MSARALVLVLLGVLAIALPHRAWAQQSKPEIHFGADADVVGAGDVFHVTLEALSSTSSPSDPQLGSSAGFVIRGISPSTSTQMSIVNGTISRQVGLTTVWTLYGTKIGSFTIGPPTVTVDGTKYHGQSISIRVVPPSQAPPRAPPPSVFDPFGGLFGQLQGQLQQMPGFPQPQPQAVPQADPSLALDAARAQGAFLHATIDKPSAVVGEQVTFTVYVYIDLTVTREPDLSDLHEAPAPDFVRRPLQPDEAKLQHVGYAEVGGKMYEVELLRKSALFPLKTGDLDIGEMTVQVNPSGNGLRRSETLHVHVSEPPVQGRPPGYAVGDVGSFTVSADVSGRDIEQDGAIGVTVTLEGAGNLPATLTPPERPGVEWLDPQVTAKLAADKGGRFGGSRTFQYVVRFHKPGDVDLGELALPYWDPARGYAVARAPLGSIHVRPGAAPSPAQQAADDPLPGLPAPRARLERVAPHRGHLDDAPQFWLGLGAMPLAYAFYVGATGAVARVRARRAAAGASPRAELRSRMLVAESAAKDGDARAIDAATARALEAATIAGCRVNVRGLATSDVATALAGAGVTEEDAREVEALLRACEAARFSAAGPSGGGADEARVRWGRARSTIERLAGRS